MGDRYNIVLRAGRPQDARDFSRLVLSTAPRYFLHLFGHKARSIIEALFRHSDNEFSYENSYFIEADGRVAGMVAFCDCRKKTKRDIRTAFLVLRYMKWEALCNIVSLLRAQRRRHICSGECYLSYLSVFPSFRRLGFAKILLQKIENIAIKLGAKRIVLRTDVGNSKAISLYEKSGYKIKYMTSPLKIRGTDFQFFTIIKDLA